MEHPPPPYTRARLETQITSSKAIKDRMHRFLLDSVAFVYGVDYIPLRNAIASTILLQPDGTFNSTPALDPTPLFLNHDTTPDGEEELSRTSILTQDDRDEILYLAVTVRDISTKIKKHQQSLITARQINLINTHVVRPSEQLCSDSLYSLDLLLLYAEHKGQDRQLAGPYFSWRIPFFGRLMLPQIYIAERVISDEILLESVAPNERTHILLEGAVARFGEKHWLDRRNVDPSRSLWCSFASVGVLRLIRENTPTAAECRDSLN